MEPGIGVPRSRHRNVGRRPDGDEPVQVRRGGQTQARIHAIPRELSRVLVHHEPGRGEPGLPSRREVAGPATHPLSEHAGVEVMPIAARSAIEDVLGRHAQEVGVDDLESRQGILVAREPSVIAVLQR